MSGNPSSINRCDINYFNQKNGFEKNQMNFNNKSGEKKSCNIFYFQINKLTMSILSNAIIYH